MAFDLVQYFTAQIKSQKPQLFGQFSSQDKNDYIAEVNALTLGRIISLWRHDDTKTYQEIHAQDPLYIQEIARHLTTSKHNQSQLSKTDLEQVNTEFLTFQFAELKQLDETGHYGKSGLHELLVGQIEHLSGQAKDWVWSTNELNELIGSQPVVQEVLSLDDTMKEFNQMVHNQTSDDPEDNQRSADQVAAIIPTWSKILEPLVALAILAILYCTVQSVFA